MQQGHLAEKVSGHQGGQICFLAVLGAGDPDHPAADQEKLFSAITTDYTKAELSTADMAMLKYAKKLTLEPAAMSAADVNDLRAHGFDDLAIHDICAITAYFNFVNRMADGLGVELEPHVSSTMYLSK